MSPESGKLYLRPNVVPEPLIDNWYAWPHLISPATASMNITGRHLKIMNSYIQAPMIHAAAVKNPKMLGGPFMDYGGKRVDEVKSLRENTLLRCSSQIAFSEAVGELQKMLSEHAKGYSLEPLYEKVPDILRGYVELVYDLNNQPSFRFFEALLYHSPFYDESLQSIALYRTDDDERPFVLSTPRLPGDGILHLNIPFRHHGLDELFRMRREARSFEYISALLGIRREQEELFRTFFTEERPEEYARYTGEGIRTRYFGHACILVETKNVSILSDPVISYYGYDQEVSRFTYADLPDEIDYVVISHNHQDHILFETMLQIRHKVKNVIVPKSGGGALQDPNLRLMFREMGFANVIEMDEMERMEFGDCTITGIPFLGEHGDLDIRTKLCYKVQIGDFSLMFAADSCNIEPKLYEHVEKISGKTDVLFLGMECDGAPSSWLYGPLYSEQLQRDMDHSRRLAGSNFARGMDMVERFGCREVYVYAMGQEPWLNYIMSIRYTEDSNPIIASNRLIDEARQRNITAERLFGEKEILYEARSAGSVPDETLESLAL